MVVRAILRSYIGHKYRSVSPVSIKLPSNEYLSYCDTSDPWGTICFFYNGHMFNVNDVKVHLQSYIGQKYHIVSTVAIALSSNAYVFILWHLWPMAIIGITYHASGVRGITVKKWTNRMKNENFQPGCLLCWHSLSELPAPLAETLKIVGPHGVCGACFFQLQGPLALCGVRVPPSTKGSCEQDCWGKVGGRALLNPA